MTSGGKEKRKGQAKVEERSTNENSGRKRNVRGSHARPQRCDAERFPKSPEERKGLFKPQGTEFLWSVKKKKNAESGSQRREKQQPIRGERSSVALERKKEVH